MAKLRIPYHPTITFTGLYSSASPSNMAIYMAYSSPYTASFLHSLPQLSPLSAFSFLSPPRFLPRYSVSVSVSAPQPISSIPIRCSSRADFDPKAGVSVYKPKSYEVLVTDAASSLAFALDDGKTRLEIDFP